MGVEAEHGLRGADFYGDYVPDVQRDYVGGYEVDVAFVVGDVAAADGVRRAGFVGIGAEAVGALDLDAEEVDSGLGTIVEDEVVALAVLVEESRFGTFSGALGVGTVGIVGAAGRVGHRDSWVLFLF